METVTSKSIAEKLQMPEAKAARWHKWLARGNPELSLNMLLCRAAELHKADGKKICRILFEIYDENDDGVLPRSEAKEVSSELVPGQIRHDMPEEHGHGAGHRDVDGPNDLQWRGHQQDRVDEARR